MWIPKCVRDEHKGVDSPIPTQAVSNEEFIPRPQTKQQEEWEYAIGYMGEENARKLGMDRRDYMRTTMGMATAFLAANKVYGNYWQVDEKETLDPAAAEEKWPKDEYFIFDVQTHFTNNVPLPMRAMTNYIVKGLGAKLDNKVESYSFKNFVKEIFFDSDTSMAVISGIPGKEFQRDGKGKLLDGPKRGGGILPSWLMSQSKKQLNEVSGSKRVLCQGNCSPNHYWDHKNKKPNFNELFEQMEREVKQYGIDSWKWYCHMDPGRSGNGFRMDDEKMAYPFYEKSKELGLNVFSCHKGFASQSRKLGHFTHPGDMEKAAIDHPDLTFVVYHSALKHGPGEPGFKDPKFFDPKTGDFIWHNELMKIKQRNPKMNNVYCEIGSSFGLLAVLHPLMAQHLIAKNVKYYGADHVIWGTDCLWWGSPQWVIDAFKRFQISDELCEKFGYKKLTKKDKAKIFGLNAAKVYGIDLKAKLKQFPKDTMSKLKLAYLDSGGTRDNGAHGWVRKEA